MVNRDRIFLLVAVLIPTVSFAGSTVGTSTIDDSQSDVFGSSTTHGSSAPASAVTLGVTDTNVPPDIGLNKTEVVKEGYVVSQVEAITVTTHSMVRVTADQASSPDLEYGRTLAENRRKHIENVTSDVLHEHGRQMEVTSRHRDNSSAHRRGAIDISSKNLSEMERGAEAQDISARLGPHHRVVVEEVHRPKSGVGPSAQKNTTYQNGAKGDPTWQPVKATATHTHVQPNGSIVDDEAKAARDRAEREKATREKAERKKAEREKEAREKAERERRERIDRQVEHEMRRGLHERDRERDRHDRWERSREIS